MKHRSLKRVLALALCICLAVTLWSAFSPSKSAFASTCQTYRFETGGFDLLATDASLSVWQWTTCKGTTMALHDQPDGNFVLYANGQPVWATNTTGLGVHGDYAEFQTDGNLVVYNCCTLGGTEYAAWASHTSGRGATLSLQDDGNMVIYNTSGAPIWASHTSGH